MKICPTPFLLAAALLVPAAMPAATAAPPVPSVDRTTPHVQNGLALVALVRGDAQGQYRFPVPANLSFLSGPTGNGPAGGIGLWVRGKQPPPRLVHGRPVSYFNGGMPSAYGRSASGEIIPIQCEPQFYNQTSAAGQPPTPLYLLTLPGGYPPHYGPITVTMTTQDGHRANWRLDNLPASYHALSESSPLHSTFTQGGVALKVQAWQDDGPASLPVGQRGGEWSGIRYLITGTVPPKSSWLVRITGEQLEWEALPPGPLSSLGRPGGPMYGFRPPLCSVFFGPRPSAPGPSPMGGPMNGGGGMVQTPYDHANHRIHLTGQLVKLATAQETVTFHDLNVRARPNPYSSAMSMRGPHGRVQTYTPPPSYVISARPQTVTTPSGVSITLLPFSSLPQNQGYFGGGNGVQMLLRFNAAAPGMMPVSLPRSPLARRYHKPVTLTLSAATPLMLQQVFPINGFGPQMPHGGGTEYVVTLVATGQPKQVAKTFNGRRFMTFQMPALPKHLSSLTLTLSQQAELHTTPLGFLVPIQPKAPPMPGMMRPRGPLSRPARQR